MKQKLRQRAGIKIMLLKLGYKVGVGLRILVNKSKILDRSESCPKTLIYSSTQAICLRLLNFPRPGTLLPPEPKAGPNFQLGIDPRTEML